MEVSGYLNVLATIHPGKDHLAPF